MIGNRQEGEEKKRKQNFLVLSNHLFFVFIQALMVAN
jgi:hypothetical protein